MMRGSILVALCVVLALASADVHAQRPQSVAELVVGNRDFSILLEAVQAADPAVLELLASTEFDGTVFAPNNRAFERLLKELKVTKGDLLKNKELLTKVLLYHVFPTFPVYSKDLGKRQWVQTLVSGKSGILKITKVRRNRTPVVRLYTTSGGGAAVIAADVKAGKAVVHVINRVLIPGNKVRWPKAKVIV